MNLKISPSTVVSNVSQVATVEGCLILCVAQNLVFSRFTQYA